MQVEFTEVSPDLVEAAIGQYEKELERAIKESDSQTQLHWVRGQLLLGQMKMYIGTVNTGAMAGFIITELTNSAKGPWISIPFGWADPQYRGKIDLFASAIRNLMDTCRAMNFQGVRMMSIRKGMFRRAIQLGFEPRFIEYVKRVDKE